MSEANCHYQHRNFNPGQQCVYCDYQEPYMQEFKREIKNKLEELLDCFVNYGTGTKASSDLNIRNPLIPLYHIYLTEEKLMELKQSIWYDYDIPDLIDEIIRDLNKF